jgi:hypothetical protein
MPTTGEFQTQKGCFTAMQCPKFHCEVDYTREPMRALLELAKQLGESSNWTIDGIFYDGPRNYTGDNFGTMLWLAEKLTHERRLVPPPE